MVPCHVRDLDALFTSVDRAFAKAGVFGKRVHWYGRWHRSGDDRTRSGLWPGDPGARLKDKRGKLDQIEVTVTAGKRASGSRP